MEADYYVCSCEKGCRDNLKVEGFMDDDHLHLSSMWLVANKMEMRAAMSISKDQVKRLSSQLLSWLEERKT